MQTHTCLHMDKYGRASNKYGEDTHSDSRTHSHVGVCVTWIVWWRHMGRSEHQNRECVCRDVVRLWDVAGEASPGNSKPTSVTSVWRPDNPENVVKYHESLVNFVEFCQNFNSDTFTKDIIVKGFHSLCSTHLSNSIMQQKEASCWLKQHKRLSCSVLWGFSACKWSAKANTQSSVT